MHLQLSPVMRNKKAALFTLYALFQCIQESRAGHTEYDGFPGSTDPSNYMFYDPTEECKATTDPCIISFKYCSHHEREFRGLLWNSTCPENAKQGDLSWGASGNQFWIEDDEAPPAVFDPFANYTLKWVNNNPDYPTTIKWSPNTFIASNYYMYQVVGPGKTSFDFSFNNLSTQMLPGLLVPANGSTDFEHNMTQIVTQLVTLAPQMRFEIGQPTDPKYANHTEWSRNSTDQTPPFRLESYDADILNFAQKDARGYMKQEMHKFLKKWRLGVGIGVGLGVPLLMLIAFTVGKKSGAKEAKRHFTKDNVPLE